MNKIIENIVFPIKKFIRKSLILFSIDATKNLEYDRLTKKIMRYHLKPNDNCIDVGVHKGEILDDILKYSPSGKHYAFEPIPYLYKKLKLKYKNNVSIYPYALSSKEGESSFQMVVNAPAYSGIKNRNYDDIKNPEIKVINVELKRLDNIIPKDEIINFIKIDVEGGEYDVLRGGIELLRRNKPIIIFECGSGGCDYYGASSNDVYNLITKEIGLRIFTLKAFLNNEPFLKEKEFENYFKNKKEYYYIAKA